MCYAISMPRFHPFAGLRYDPARVDLSMVISPPYDVVDPAERDVLAGRHSANSVRIELPEADHRAGLDRYANAARQLADWQSAGTLVRDPAPALYVYRMTTPAGAVTTGVIGALDVDTEGSSDVLPHEQTLPKPRSDRLDLLRATGANLSPIWGLSLAAGLTGEFTPVGPAASSATDDDGVHHELWVLDDPDAVARVAEAVSASPVVIADGHHRYETARQFAGEVGATGGPLSAGAASVMALVVELAEDQLTVGAFHRVLSELPDGLDLVDVFASWFDVTRAGEFDDRTTSALGESGAFSLLMPSGAWLLSPKDGTAEAAGSDLDASTVALVIAELPDHELEFVHTWSDAVAAVGSDRAQAAVLLRPATVGQIAEWARAGRRMPPKTTYFFPKPRTGMVFRTLAG